MINLTLQTWEYDTQIGTRKSDGNKGIMIRVHIHMHTHVRCFTPLTEENVIERNKLSAMGYLQVSFPLQ